jgi:N-acetylglucosamine-6-sulfatase
MARPLRHVLAILGSALALLALAFSARLALPLTDPEAARAAPDAAQTRLPNIVFILTDDLDTDSVAYMPRVQALLAAQGVTFTNMFVTYPLCCPSRASILTGQYPHNHDNLGVAPPLGGFAKFRNEGREESTIATWLQAAGYRTGLFGKYLNGYPDPVPAHVPPGWTTWVGGTSTIGIMRTAVRSSTAIGQRITRRTSLPRR